MFCPKCGAILIPKLVKGKKVLACGCGYKSNTGNTVISEKCDAKQECVEVVEKSETRPLVEEECPKCKHKKARSWERQMRAADEPATRFYECEKCKQVWRDQS
jgi:DNA-directed RNA polymerase subunit M